MHDRASPAKPAGPLFERDLGIQRPAALIAGLIHPDGRRRRSARRDELIYRALGARVWDDGYTIASHASLGAVTRLPKQRIGESIARLKAAGLVVVVVKGYSAGRGPTGRASVYELPDFSAALERMCKRTLTRPALAAQAAQAAAAIFEAAAMRVSTGGETHPARQENNP